MLWDASTIKGYEVEASDGPIGTVSDWLFEDVGWAVRWLVVDVGHWPTGRKVLLPHSVLDQPDRSRRRLTVKLTMQQVKDSPDVDTDQPVSRQDAAYFGAFGIYLYRREYPGATHRRPCLGPHCGS